MNICDQKVVNARLQDRMKRLEEGLGFLELADERRRFELGYLLNKFLPEGTQGREDSRERSFHWSKPALAIPVGQPNKKVQASRMPQEFSLDWEAYLQQKRVANAALESQRLTNLGKRRPEPK